MEERKLLPISAFKWASVSQYIVYIGGAAGLQEVNSGYVLCLPLTRVAPAKLLARKMRVALILKANLKSLERFVERFKAELEPGEMSVLRGMYRQFKNNLETVEGHMETIEDFAQASNKAMFEQSEEKDDLPF